ncbi:hypothetical protein GCM10010946_12250 [Undibacterium squillarum]|uniref:Uncharacterized protein n=1 Tax=Undibacterium squillarum TaxID=1131567 RepID=A0ABQ2XWE9_9BURK|nr:hypothetical protein GCM10010946_12250 [Undibacterium squillarum]
MAHFNAPYALNTEGSIVTRWRVENGGIGKSISKKEIIAIYLMVN